MKFQVLDILPNLQNPVTRRLVNMSERHAGHFRDHPRSGPGLQPAAVIDKIMWWHEAFGHSLKSFSLPTMIPHEQQLEMLSGSQPRSSRLSARPRPPRCGRTPTPTAADPRSPGARSPTPPPLIEGMA